MSIRFLEIFDRKFKSLWAAVWLGLLYISVCGVCDLPGARVLPCPLWESWVIVVLICCFKASVAALSLWLCRRYRLLSVAAFSVVTIYCILCLVNGVVYSFYGMGVTIRLMTVLSQTNGVEVREFIPSLMSNMWAVLCRVETYVVIALIAMSFVGVMRIKKRTFGIGAAFLSVVGFVVLVTVLLTISASRTNFSVTGRVVKSAYQSYSERKQIDKCLKSKSPLPYPETVRSCHLADVYLIIGESASRGHLSIYGYPLETSPVLCGIDEGLIVFEDAIGSSTTTAFNMNRVLTFLSDNDDAMRWSESAMLYGVLEKAGYHTAWISNQEMSGIWSNSTLAMVSDADYISYVGSISSDDATLMRYDEVVLPEVARLAASDDEPKFIGVHLMGSHVEYWRRYPAEAGIFDADSALKVRRDFKLSRSHATIVAEYDNSIRYTDYILGKIIGHVDRNRRPAVMIYFSDHGENVYDDNDNFFGRDSRHVEVPFVIYANSRFREECRNLYDRLKIAASKPLSTADITHLICTLTGTGYHCYDDTRDVSSPLYMCMPRYVDDVLWESERTKSYR